MRIVIRQFDSLVRWANGVFEFCDDPECLLRLQVAHARHALDLSDGTHVCTGERVLLLHLWNEHVPPLGPGGSDLAWAAQLGRRLVQSMHAAAEEADFFKVMDYHLSNKSGVLDIPRNALNKYEFQRGLDKTMRAINYLNKGESQEAKRLLRESLSTMAFRGAVQSIARPKLLSFWLCGILLLGSGPLRRYLAKSLRWLMRRLDRRVI